MIIGIDGIGLSKFKGTGCYSYVYGLISNLLEEFAQPKYEIMLASGDIPSSWKRYHNVSYYEIEMDRQKNDYVKLEDYLKNHTNLYFSPYNGFSLPTNKVCSYMMSVHDLAPLWENSYADRVYSDKFKQLFPVAINNSDIILAVSQFVKDEILKHYTVSEDKIEVVHPCCLGIFKPLNYWTAYLYIKEKYHIEKKFILYAGSIHRRKQLELLIKAFAGILDSIGDYQLVIVGDYIGKRNGYYKELINLVQVLQLKNEVRFTGKVELNDMPYFYNCAGCCVNLSTYEGYPLTVLEASSCGTPVLCLRNTSFIELKVENIIYLEEADQQLIQEELLKLLVRDNKVHIQEVNQEVKSKYTRYNETIKLIHRIESIIYNC